MSEARKHLETEVKAAKYLKESTVMVSVDHLDALLKASPPSGGEVIEACILGVGCETYGVCYAMANGDSGKCGKNRGDL